ncbi:hypothetical protein EDB80DRAFT_729633 [Ilyonectria destructans]|nr:hypothetical protein EDB80DRAFT_729633 [Ilyonectria destructans]
MKSLIHLPEDIIRCVFEFLSHPNLKVWCLVSKRFRRLAEPWLYNRIEWHWRALLAGRGPPIVPLLRNILSRPELSTYIRSISIHGYDEFHPLGEAPFEAPISEGGLGEIVQYIKGTGVPYEDLWIRGLLSNKLDAYLAVLVSRLSNLTSLRVDTIWARETRILGMVFRSALFQSSNHGFSTFRHLQELSFFCEWGTARRRDPGEENTADVLPFFYLPGIRRFTATIDNPITFTWPIKTPDASSLTFLSLNHIREVHLVQLLSVTKNLKTLEWQWYYDPNAMGETSKPIVDLEQIGFALFHVRATLTSLCISTRKGEWGAAPLQINGSLRTLVGCSKLQRLEIPLTLLLGFSPPSYNRLEDILPNSLEYLTITDGLRNDPGNKGKEYDYLCAIRRWLRNIRKSTPNLCELIWPTGYGWKKGQSGLWGQVGAEEDGGSDMTFSAIEAIVAFDD